MYGSWTVLLVEEDEEALERIGGWLREEGYSVLMCAGPRGSGVACPGGHGEACPLAAEADVVILDVSLDGDTMMEGPPGWQILLYYLEIGKPVVALTEPGDPIDLATGDERVIELPRHAGREELLLAVRSLAGIAPQRPRSGRVTPMPFHPDKRIPASTPSWIEAGAARRWKR